MTGRGHARSLPRMNLLNLLRIHAASWTEAERGRLVLWVPVAMTAGAAACFLLARDPPSWAGAAMLLAGVTAATLLRRRPAMFAGAVLVAALALGFTSAQFAVWRAPPWVQLPRTATVIAGNVQAVESLPVGTRVTITSPRLDDAPPLQRMLRVRLRADDPTQLRAGDSVQVRALVMAPAPPAYPGAWDLQFDAYFDRIGGYGYALGPIMRGQDAAPPRPGSWLQWLREAIAARVGAALPRVTGAIATTLLTGETAAIPPPDRAAFRDSGLAHLLAIAGLHIGIVMGLVFGVVRLGLVLWERAALHWPIKTVAALAALAAGAGYMLLTGAHVPIMRSFAMASLVTLGVVAGRRAFSLRGLALAMAAIVLIAPQAVLGVSFQMSFSAVLALIVGYGMLRTHLRDLHGDGGTWRRFVSHIVALALTSALAGTFSAPFAAYHFGHVQIYFVIANMLAVPLTAFWVMPAGMAALLLMPLHLEALALIPMGWGIGAVQWIGQTGSAWPAAVLAVPHIPGWGLAVLALGLAWVGLWRSQLRQFGWGLVVLGLASPMLTTPPDILISADARLIGVRADGQVLLQKSSGASNFTQDAWLQYWAGEQAEILPESGAAAHGMADCTPDACLLRPHPDGATALLLRAPAGADACTADLVVSAEPVRLDCKNRPMVIDRFSVWRQGAYAVWLRRRGVRTISDRGNRGDRPWVIPLPTRKRQAPGVVLVPAAVDE